MATRIWVNIGSRNGLLPVGTKPSSETMLNCHRWGPIIWGKFHKNNWIYGGWINGLTLSEWEPKYTDTYMRQHVQSVTFLINSEGKIKCFCYLYDLILYWYDNRVFFFSSTMKFPKESWPWNVFLSLFFLTCVNGIPSSELQATCS